MGKHKHSGGGKGMSKMLKPIKGLFKRKENDDDVYDQHGDSDDDEEYKEYEEEDEEIPRVLPIVIVSKYQIHRDFKPYKAQTPHSHFKLGKCYEYVYVDSVSPDGKTAWATMRPNFAGTYLYESSPRTTYIRNYPPKYTPNNVRPENVEIETIRFKVEENGIKYTNFVESPSTLFELRYKAIWFREVPCHRGIPSLQYLAYNQVRPEVKRALHNTIDFPVPDYLAEEPKRGGNSVKRNKRLGRKTRRKSSLLRVYGKKKSKIRPKKK